MYAEVQGWQVVKVYADEGLSAFKDRIKDRPQLRQMLDAAANGLINAVIVHKLDRFSRRVSLLMEAMEKFEKQGVQFVSFSEQMDFSTPVGRMILTNLGGFAEYFSRNLATEVAKGKREKAEQGGWVGPIPIGYKKGPDGTLVPSADAPVVQWIFQLYVTRQYSYTRIADELNTAYIGMVSSGGVQYQGKHPPLVDMDTFDAVQGIRADRTLFHGTPIQHHAAWLTSVLWCAHCGGKLWHQFGGRDSTIRYYRCSGVSRRECTTKQIKALTLEGEMAQILNVLVIPDALIPEIIAEARRLAGTHEAPPDLRDQSPSFVALARHALAQVALPGGPMTVMTGMPAAWFADGAARTALEGAVRAAGSDWNVFNVSVAPEAAGVFYAAVFAGGGLDLTSTRGAVGVIDAGYRDVNVALFHDGRYISGESVPGGMADALREVRRLISRQYGLELALHEVDEAVRAGGLEVTGVNCPLPDGTDAALLRSLDTIIATGRSLWPNGGRGLRALVLGGGGAVALGPALHAVFPQLSVPGVDLRGRTLDQVRAAIIAAQPQLAGARGFAAVVAARQQR